MCFENCVINGLLRALKSHLRTVKWELESLYCGGVLANLKDSLAILPVFKDPGIHFNLRNKDLVVIEKHEGALDCPRSGPGQGQAFFSGPGPGPHLGVRARAGPGSAPGQQGKRGKLQFFSTRSPLR